MAKIVNREKMAAAAIRKYEETGSEMIVSSSDQDILLVGERIVEM